MTETSPNDSTTVSHEKIVLLNQDIGYMLINNLKGLDAINFMEAVNGSDQFRVIEITEDYFFNVTFMKLSKKEKIKINIPYCHLYLDSAYIDDQGYLYPQKYDQGEAPPLRLFIHPNFTTDAFAKLCFTYKTASFQCYSRLLPFNTHSYVGNLMLIDYFNYKNLIGCTRELNNHEKYLFKENQNNQLNLVQTMSQFITNFENRFKSREWIEVIDFTKFHISGGCILNSLFCEPFLDTSDQEVDVNFNGTSYAELKDAVLDTFARLTSVISRKTGQHPNITFTKKDNGVYTAKLHVGVTLSFHFKYVPDATAAISYILHSSDIDISQIAYTGSQIVCTFAFLQAIASRSFICYTLHGDIEKCIYNRINRYCQRGFVFLEPQRFNALFYMDIMVKTVFELKTEETREILDDDGEVQTVTITREPNQVPMFNVDTFLLQETFIKKICSQEI